MIQRKENYEGTSTQSPKWWWPHSRLHSVPTGSFTHRKDISVYHILPHLSFLSQTSPFFLKMLCSLLQCSILSPDYLSVPGFCFSPKILCGASVEGVAYDAALVALNGKCDLGNPQGMVLAGEVGLQYLRAWWSWRSYGGVMSSGEAGQSAQSWTILIQ